MVLKQDPESFMSKHEVEIEMKGDKEMLEYIKEAIEKSVQAHNADKSNSWEQWALK